MTKAIEKIQTEKGVMFAELDTVQKETVLRDKSELEKLLAHSHVPSWLVAEPAKEKRQRNKVVTVRCNRQTGLWELLDKNQQVVHKIERGILANVRFSSFTETRTLRGCGSSYDETIHVGVAKGNLLPKDSPVVIPESTIMKLQFDIYTGRFLYRKDRYSQVQAMDQAAYLILKDKCHSEVIIQPK